MKRRWIAALASSALALTAFAPAAQAQRGHGYYERHGDGYHDDDYRYDRRHRGYDRRGHYYRRHDDNNDEALAAGVIGLVLGVALGAAVSQRREPAYANCYDNYQRCDPPPRYYDRGYGGRDYPPPASECTRRERQWDRYANRYVTVDVPC